MMCKYNSMVQTTLDFLSPGSVLISEQLYLEMLDIDEPVYNDVFAIGGPGLSYDVSDKLMSAVLTTSQKTSQIFFENIRISREDATAQLQTKIGLFGGMATLLCVLTLIVIYRNRIAHLEYERNRVWLLKALGCEGRLLKRIYRRTSLAVLILVVTSVNLLCLGYRVLTGPFQLFATGSLLDDLWLASRLECYGFPWLFCLLPQAVFLTAFYLILCLTSRRLSETSEAVKG